jgi:transcription initiation factor TFIIIB Brf1 subunit/transcription initiation factor TFIIB
MPKCPNCEYMLVLLEKRMKYKCAKCGRLFRQKEIDIKEFAEWNKNERAKEKIEAAGGKLILEEESEEAENEEEEN